MPVAVPPRVVVFGLGGTIAMTTAVTGGVTPALSPGQLIAAVPGLDALGIDIDVVSFRSRPGASLTFEDLADLAAAISEHLEGGATGVVVTQGTDTIEESAYLLDLFHDRPEPVIVTGAMRNPALAGADGPANLLAAITAAAHPATRSWGCLVLLNDDIHAASRVSKTHSTSTATFASRNGGPIGQVVEGTPQIFNRGITRYTLSRPGIAGQARVGMHTAVLGDDGRQLPLIAADLDGLVIAGFGVGHVPETWAGPLGAIAARIPVILASRTGAGSVLTGTYGFPGSERDLLDRGLIPAGFLGPLKARILLWALISTGTTNHSAIRQAFETAGGLPDPAPRPQRACVTADPDDNEPADA